jgi:tRNA threonylcarbamoyl adenosine modification protein YeaZ
VPDYALALYTAGPELGLGLTNFETPGRYQAWHLGRDLSVYLHTHLAEFLSPQIWADLAFIAVARGPGSFTGTRMGMVTARTLAQQLQIPLFAISTLEAAAWASNREPENHDLESTLLAVEMAAQSGQVYGAVYRIEASGLTGLECPEQLLTLEQWQQRLEQLKPTYQRVQMREGSPNTIDLCQAVLQIADRDWKNGDRPHWSEALPFYGQQEWRSSHG